MVLTRIENPGDRAVTVRNALRVERYADGHWRAVSDRELPITLEGYPTIPACVTIGPEGFGDAVDGWLGDTCFGVAPCHATAAAGAGLYRIVGRTCDGVNEIVGNQIQWPGRE
jgi:hypothetical protein